MRRLMTLAFAIAVILLGNGRPAEPIAAEVALPLLEATQPGEMCLMPGAGAEAGTEAGQAAADRLGPLAVPADWPGKDVLGGDVPATRIVTDPYPTYDGLAVDPDNGVVVMSDENRSGLFIYDVKSGSRSNDITEPKRHIIGPRTKLGFIAGVTLDPRRREAWVTNNDGGGVEIFSYDSHGDAKPVRSLDVPHQSWGLSLDIEHDEIAVTSQQYQAISIFKRTDTGAARPARTIRGEDTRLADPHGVHLRGNEVLVANHGNWTEMRSYSDDAVLLPGEYKPGRFERPSIRVYPADAHGNVKPIRTIQGSSTQLAWPMGIDVDHQRGEIAVANYGTNAILFFPKRANGDTAPSRVLGGSRTGIVGPVGIGIDATNNEIWIASYGDHSAVVFDRDASGNVEPKRIIRNAPAGTPTTGFTNASAAAYDSKRGEILVPN